VVGIKVGNIFTRINDSNNRLGLYIFTQKKDTKGTAKSVIAYTGMTYMVTEIVNVNAHHRFLVDPFPMFKTIELEARLLEN